MKIPDSTYDDTRPLTKELISAIREPPICPIGQGINVCAKIVCIRKEIKKVNGFLPVWV